MYEFLESQGIRICDPITRKPGSARTHRRSAARPVRRPPREVWRTYASFRYKAGSSTGPRRVVAKVEWHLGELFARWLHHHEHDLLFPLAKRFRGAVAGSLGWWNGTCPSNYSFIRRMPVEMRAWRRTCWGWVKMAMTTQVKKHGRKAAD